MNMQSVENAYECCRQVTAKHAKTFYLGTLLMPPAKRRAIWAIYAWCRRTDDLVDQYQAKPTTLSTLAAWEEDLEAIFAGKPKDEPDLALADTLAHFPLDIQPFRDMIAGQRMDLERCRYEKFTDLHLYCYRVAGTVGLMSMAVMGVEKTGADVSREAIALGIANQLTNILRDVGEDAGRGRIYIPLQELAQFSYTEADLLQGVIDERWRQLMQWQIHRAKHFYTLAEQGIPALSRDARLPVFASLMLYRRILDVIESNGYDVFNRRAYVPMPRKLLTLPIAWWKVLTIQKSSNNPQSVLTTKS
ncbi:phytoene synthase [Kalymmatonema gypsitolerans NIES-4073]|uniref:phytoene synthase n=1 Tax=Scytonema sp. HK-05 TaxID=1137095 RepID=UPI000935DF78|nr:phytoene synthase [Scytonema sp. HK-05]OKH60760.1 phytoene synthase [Scytonema sp. HK-05]BAY45054.1 phytoene synthase [Scytonema sp. HK-05]BAZ25469.1 phytoene synthase [Scytonema sp. NIES-4073]